ncbi:MAG: hypothetical protein ETSY1_01150 [Candidatus Entotheonella factor]|uniref:Acyl-CoA dehydrogenase n=1 Tax=Entotheonella factor TaxID=1429438 RepID=W4M0D3_ENTF1|nr:MAG: hypothetical protein ETSY1_01150 [Candidatus Entotheonella factor]
MKFSFSDEQVEFRTALRRFLSDVSPSVEVRRWMETDIGYDADVWRQMSQDLGLTAIHIPEAYGGQEYGVSELAIATEEMGRALLCAPFFSSTVMGATAIMKAGSEEQKQTLLSSIAAGEVISTLAFTELDGRWEAEAVAMTAAPANGTYVLNGTKSFVLDGHSADLLVVVARRPGSQGTEGLSLFTVAGDAAGIDRVLLKSTDPTRKLAKLTFSNVEASLLGQEGEGAGPLRETLDIAAICLANEMAGGAERLFEDAIAYAKMRVQFGRPIASFQSLKHKAAEMLMEVELAKSGGYYAAAAADEGDADVSALASLAKAAAADTYMQTAIHAVQIHGGIGFTWENDTHLWFKRAKSSEVFLGGSDYHRERLMQEWDV